MKGLKSASSMAIRIVTVVMSVASQACRAQSADRSRWERRSKAQEARDQIPNIPWFHTCRPVITMRAFSVTEWWSFALPSGSPSDESVENQHMIEEVYCIPTRWYIS
jgi:hypothetical protein